MSRIFSALSWLLKLVLLLAVAAWLYAYPGTLEMEWQGRTVTTSTGFAGIVLLLLILLVATLYHWWRVLLALPRDWKKRRRLRSLELGYGALNKGLLSVAAGDSVTAEKFAKKALNALPDLALSHLLAAQAAQLRGDDVSADTHLAVLAQHPEGQLFGLRGQLGRAVQRDDQTEALRLARLAYQRQSTQPWAIDTLVQMEARSQHWTQVEKILRQAVRLGSENRTRWQKDLAAVLLASSDDAAQKQDIDAALECARDALKNVPYWTPAVIRAAQLWSRKTYRRRAQKTIQHAWENAPHPELVTAWLQITGAAQATDISASVARLVAANPDCYDAAMAMARASHQAGLWGVARQHALRAIEYRPDRDAYRLMAEIEQADTHLSSAVRGWMDKAADAPASPEWQCILTGDIFPHWQVLNARQDFNTIQWQTPIVMQKKDNLLTITQ